MLDETDRFGFPQVYPEKTAYRAAERNPIEGPIPLEDGGGSPASEPVTARPICGAKTRGGTPCQRSPLAGRTRCRLHGGATPCGVASPHFRHGRRSRYLKHLPADLKAGYKAALRDPELLCLNDELALLTARTTQLLDKLSATAAPPWDAAVESLNDYKMARDGDSKQKALAALEQIIRNGASAAASYEAIWRELRELVQERTRTASAEAKRMRDLNAFVTVEQAQMFLAALLAAAREVVSDRDVLQALQQRMLRLLPAPS